MNTEKYSPRQLRWWLTWPYRVTLNEMQYRHTRAEITRRYIIIHFAVYIQAHNLTLRTATTPSQLMWIDFYLLFQRPGKGIIINGN